MEKVQLTKNLWLHEFLEGTSMPSEAIAITYEDLEPAKLARIGVIAERIQNIRNATKKKFGKRFNGFRVCAGVRVKRWELLRERSGKSQHTEYWTADIQPICKDEDYLEIFNWIYDNFEPTWKGGFAKKEPDLEAKPQKKGFIHADCRMNNARWKY